MINYEIIKANPQQLFLQIKYTKDNCPDYWVNQKIMDFSESNIHDTAKAWAEKAKAFWDAIDNLPASVELSSTTGTAKNRVYADAPNHNATTHDATFTWVESDDAITQTWAVTEKSDEDKASVLRRQRNTLLRETDHYGLSDVTMSSEMTTYRQALRDVPQQTGFPTTVTWPTKPE